MIEQAILTLGLNKAAVIGGGAGALGSLKLFPGQTLAEKLSTFVFGWLAGACATPLLAEKASMGSHHFLGVSFFIGLLLLPVVMNFVKALPEWIAGAKTLVINKFGGSSNGNADR